MTHSRCDALVLFGATGDLASAGTLNEALGAAVPEQSVIRIDHFIGKQADQNLLYFRFVNSFV